MYSELNHELSDKFYVGTIWAIQTRNFNSCAFRLFVRKICRGNSSSRSISSVTLAPICWVVAGLSKLNSTVRSEGYLGGTKGHVRVIKMNHYF